MTQDGEGQGRCQAGQVHEGEGGEQCCRTRRTAAAAVGRRIDGKSPEKSPEKPPEKPPPVDRRGIEAERVLERAKEHVVSRSSGLPSVATTPWTEPITGGRSDKGRICFVPATAYGKGVQIEGDALGWRAVVTSTSKKTGHQLLCLVDAESGASSAKVSFKLAAP